jgi:intracellular sulfur oxidation DsrE/DsrF family protein
MNQDQSLIRLEHRFAILHEVIADYRSRLQRMEAEVVELFASNQISAISERIQEKQRIVRLVQKLEQFVACWESVEHTAIDHDTKRT